jgi:anti-anti-sigma regulatory factor/DNA-directed RNA polymerase subunit RPC12/RpoP
MGINIQLTQKDNRDYVHYVGPIDAEAEVHLAQLLPKLGKAITFNFRKVDTVNSCGVRSWINFMRELQKEERDIVFEECTSEIVMQINMIPSFKGSATIQSVYGGYVCDECGHEESVLFTAGDNLPEEPKVELPPITCSQCGAEMELEEMEEEFFAFLAA